ncbi:MAG TPA: hypothetical protein VE999_02930 [Gemmataceae bacterium]|nr:hypothetical protein [Gemmataceae bacterium]
MSLLLIALALLGWSTVASRTFHSGGIVFALLYPLTAYYLGRLIFAIVNVEPLVKRSFAVLFLLGYLALGLLQFAAHSWLPGSLGWQFAAIAAVVLLGQLLLHPREERTPAPDAGVSVYLCGFCLLAATCWARGLLRPVHLDGTEVVFRHWMDFFIHASFITRITTGPGLWAMGNGEIAGMPAIFYHYASYFGPATQTLFSGETAYDAARGCWVPLGTFLTGLAAYAVVLPWAGRAGGICAAAALLTLPDPSYYWPNNGYLGYHWLQQVGGAGMYGTSCAALALTLLLQWRRQRSRSALVLALGLTAATLLYKAQIFVVFVPLVGACVALYWPGASRWRRGLLFIFWLAACALGALLIDCLHPQEPPFALNPPYFENYSRVLAANFPEGACRRWLEAGFAGLGRSRYYAAALGICALASFGVWLGIGALLLVIALFRRQVSVADAPPWLALAIYLVLMASLNDYALVGHNKWEITHRPVVWVYFLLCTWCAASGCRLLEEPRPLGSGSRYRSFTVAALLLLLLLLPLRMGRCVQEGKSIWRFQCANVRAPNGLVESAHFLAHAGKSTDVIQDSRCDDKLIVGGLAEKRSYLARPTDWQRDKSARVRQEVGKRRERIQDLLRATSLAELRHAAEETGIRWLILHPDDDVRWPQAILETAAFVSGGFRVLDLAALPSAPRHPGDRIADSD